MSVAATAVVVKWAEIVGFPTHIVRSPPKPVQNVEFLGHSVASFDHPWVTLGFDQRWVDQAISPSSKTCTTALSCVTRPCAP